MTTGNGSGQSLAKYEATADSILSILSKAHLTIPQRGHSQESAATNRFREFKPDVLSLLYNCPFLQRQQKKEMLTASHRINIENPQEEQSRVQNEENLISKVIIVMSSVGWWVLLGSNYHGGEWLGVGVVLPTVTTMTASQRRKKEQYACRLHYYQDVPHSVPSFRVTLVCPSALQSYSSQSVQTEGTFESNWNGHGAEEDE